MKLLKQLYVIIILSVSGNSWLIAQQFNIKQYSTKQGLAGSTINHIFQDSRGYLWFASQGGGISRFDGKNFKNYSSKDGLINNDIICINEDDNGNIWIGSTEGLSVFNGVSFKNYTTQEGLSANKVYGITNTKNGNMLLSILGGGVSQSNGETFQPLLGSAELPTNNILCTLEANDQSLWIGTSKGGLIHYKQGEKPITYTTQEGLTNNSIFSLMEDKSGNLWIGTVSGGVCVLSKNKITPININDEINGDLIGSIIQDKRNNIWIATQHGLVKYDGKTFKIITEKQGLSSNEVQTLCTDREGNIWIGTLAGGACIFKNEALVTYTDKDGLPNNKINAICRDKYGNYLFGSQGNGVVYFDGKKFGTIRIKEIDESSVLSLECDARGNIWAGLDNGTILIIETTAQGTYKLKKEISSLNKQALSPIVRIKKDSKDRMWVASYGAGAFCVDGENETQYTIENGLKDNSVTTIFEDSKHRIWIGTQQGGVSVLDGTNFKTYNKTNGLADNAVVSVCEDQKGNIILGTVENGVKIFDGTRFYTLSTNEGLCSNIIDALCIDINGYLWIGTDKGLNRAKLTNNFTTESLRYYGEESGLRGTEVNTNAFYIDDQQSLWIGTTDGITKYVSVMDYPNDTPPIVIIQNIKIAYQQPDWNKLGVNIDSRTALPSSLDLSFKNNHLTFEFQALTTLNVKYQFKLEGSDDEWSPLTGNAQAVFSNITPGKHTFKVRAVNADGVWSTQEASFSFKINPPYYRTWWFFTIIIILAFSAIIGFTNYRTARLAKEKKILEEKVDERTLELKHANDKLSLAFNDIKDSIQYAKRIQQAILPIETKIKAKLSDSFILFKPRDIVSGDFYWFAEGKSENELFIAAVDCTGHGVPGAFMSMIGYTILNEIVITKGITNTSEILKHLNVGVKIALKQTENETRDGMDLALARLTQHANHTTVQFSGANRPLWIIRKDKTVEEIRSTKYAIGGLTEQNQHFESFEVTLEKGDTLYIFSDGFADQFGGERGKKLMTKQFRETLLTINEQDMSQQRDYLSNYIDWWKGNYEQVDDILVIGIRI